MKNLIITLISLLAFAMFIALCFYAYQQNQFFAFGLSLIPLSSGIMILAKKNQIEFEF